MTRALLWKEWRTQRSLVLAGLGIAAILPLFLMAGLVAGSFSYTFSDLVAALTPMFALFVWPVFAAATAGAALATDRADDSLRFLLSRPVSRARVWVVKVGAALLAFLGVVIGTSLIGGVYSFLSAGSVDTFRRSLSTQVGNTSRYDVLAFAVLFALLFVGSLYCSSFTRRPMVAALGGFLVVAGMGATIGGAWWMLLPSSPRVANMFLAYGSFAAVSLATIGIFAAAFRAFRRDDALVEGSWGAFLRPLLAVTVAVMVLAAVPGAYGAMHGLAQIALMRSGELTSFADTMLLSELDSSGLSTHVAALPLEDARAPRRVIASHASSPIVTADGAWIVYLSHGSYRALLDERAQIRAVRADGSGDHAISEFLDWEWRYTTGSLLTAPDADHVAMVSPTRVLITTISRGEAREIDLGITANIGITARNGGVVGWSADEPAELLFYRFNNRFRLGRPAEGGSPVEWGPSLRTTELLAFDPETEETRAVAAFPGVQQLRLWASARWFGLLSSRPWAHLPVWVDTADSRALYLVDTHGGEVAELSRSPCDLWGFSGAGDLFLYGRCSGEMRTGDARIEIRVRTLATGADETFTVLEGYVGTSASRELLLSPEGERVLLYARHGYGSDWSTWLITRDGTVRTLAEHMLPLRWMNDGEVLLGSTSPYGEWELAIVDVETGGARDIYP